MYVKVVVYTGRKTDSLTTVGSDRFEVLTTKPAERNLANERVREMVAEHYGVLKRQVRIINGHHHPRKLLEVIQDE